MKISENATGKTDQVLEMIIQKITSMVSVKCIYCIGQTNKTCHQEGIFKTQPNQISHLHFDLLVITEQACDAQAFNLQTVINQDPHIDASVMLLIHSEQNVNKRLLEHSSFFYNVLNSDKLVYQKKGTSALVIPKNYDAAKEQTEKDYCWINRNNRAKTLINAIENVAYGAEIVEVFLLNQAMEQICKGFIFFNLGYKPSQQSLKHLFNLCRYINPIIDEVFPSTTDKVNQDIFKTLVDTPNNMRHRIGSHVDPTDLGILYRRCFAWMEKAEELVLIKAPHLQSSPSPQSPF